MNKFLQWLENYGFPPEYTREVVIGFMIGLEFFTRHPDVASLFRTLLAEDYRRQAAGSLLLYQAAAVAHGDERTGPEIVADAIAESLDFSACT